MNIEVWGYTDEEAHALAQVAAGAPLLADRALVSEYSTAINQTAYHRMKENGKKNRLWRNIAVLYENEIIYRMGKNK